MINRELILGTNEQESTQMHAHEFKYRAIGFDIDDTLYDFQSVMRHSLEFTLERIRKRVPNCDLTVDKMIEIRNRVAEEMKGKTKRLEKVRLRAFERTLQHYEIDDARFAKTLNAIYLRNRFKKAGFFEDVFPVLKLLKDRYKLGIISNGNTYPKKLGLEEYFNFIVLSWKVGIRKPDRKIFAVAVQKAKCTPREFLYVGDSQEDDIVGAREAGIPVVWLNRRNEELKANIPRPDYEINTLNHLLRVLENV